MPLILYVIYENNNKYVQVAQLPMVDGCNARNAECNAIIPNILSFSQVQKIPNFTYQIFQTLQIYSVYEKDYIKYKYDRK